jgi:hypothetical protein
MCINVERAHIEALQETLDASIRTLKKNAADRSRDFLLQLDPAYATPTIIFRDFPKSHGNILQKAVGIALNSHVGGYTKTEMRFDFLSGCAVSVDNFFLRRISVRDELKNTLAVSINGTGTLPKS